MPSFTLVVVAESPNDVRALRTLLNELLSSVEWMDGLAPETIVDFVGLDGSADWLDIHKLHDLEDRVFRGRRPKYGQHHGGRSGLAGELRRFLRVWRHWRFSGERPSGVVWHRDGDGRRDLTDCLVEYRDAEEAKLPNTPSVTLGCPHESMEAWIVAGFVAQTRAEEQVLADERSRLGFDPIAQPHWLSHKSSVPKSSKRVVECLGLLDREKAANALRRALEVDANIRTAIGLEAFVKEARERVVTLVDREV